jgi:hypothetical protein
MNNMELLEKAKNQGYKLLSFFEMQDLLAELEE